MGEGIQRPGDTFLTLSNLQVALQERSAPQDLLAKVGRGMVIASRGEPEGQDLEFIRGIVAEAGQWLRKNEPRRTPDDDAARFAAAPPELSPGVRYSYEGGVARFEYPRIVGHTEIVMRTDQFPNIHYWLLDFSGIQVVLCHQQGNLDPRAIDRFIIDPMSREEIRALIPPLEVNKKLPSTIGPLLAEFRRAVEAMSLNYPDHREHPLHKTVTKALQIDVPHSAAPDTRSAIRGTKLSIRATEREIEALGFRPPMTPATTAPPGRKEVPRDKSGIVGIGPGKIKSEFRFRVEGRDFVAHWRFIDFAGIIAFVSDRSDMAGYGLRIIKPDQAAIVTEFFELLPKTALLSASDRESEGTMPETVWQRLLPAIDNHSVEKAGTEGIKVIPGGRDRFYLMAPDDHDLLASLGLDSKKYPEIPITRLAPINPPEGDHLVYTLKNPKVIGHVRVDVDVRKIHRDYWLLDFAGIPVEIYHDDGSPEFGMGIQDQKNSAAIRVAIPPPGQQKRITRASELDTLRETISQGTIVRTDDGAPDHPLRLRVQGFSLLLTGSLESPDLLSTISHSEYHVLDDPFLLLELGCDPTVLPQPVLLSTHPDKTHLTFPVLSPKPVDTHQPEAVGLREGTYKISEPLTVAHFTLPKVDARQKKPIEAYFFDYAGVLVEASYWEGRLIRLSIAKSGRQEEIRRFLNRLKRTERPMATSVPLGDTEASELLGLIRDSFFDDIHSDETVKTEFGRVLRKTVSWSFPDPKNNRFVLEINEDSRHVSKEIGFAGRLSPDWPLTTIEYVPPDAKDPVPAGKVFYILDCPRIVGHVTLEHVDGEGKGKTEEIWLLEFAGVHLVLHEFDKRQIEYDVVNPEQVEALREIIRPVAERTRISDRTLLVRFHDALKAIEQHGRAMAQERGLPVIRSYAQFMIDRAAEGVVRLVGGRLHLLVDDMGPAHPLTWLGYNPAADSPTAIFTSSFTDGVPLEQEHPVGHVADRTSKPVKKAGVVPSEPVTTGKGSLRFSLILRDAAGAPRWRYDFIDFEGLLVVAENDLSSGKTEDIFLVWSRTAVSLLRKYGEWPKEGAEEVPHRDDLLRVLRSNGKSLYSASGALPREGMVRLDLPQGQTPREDFWKTTGILFPRGIDEARHWGWEGPEDPTIALSNPLVSGTVGVRGHGQVVPAVYRLLQFPDHTFLVSTDGAGKMSVMWLNPLAKDSGEFTSFFPPDEERVRDLSYDEMVRFEALLSTCFVTPVPDEKSSPFFFVFRYGDADLKQQTIMVDLVDTIQTDLFQNARLVVPQGLSAFGGWGASVGEKRARREFGNPVILFKRGISSDHLTDFQRRKQDDRVYYLLEMAGMTLCYMSTSKIPGMNAYKLILVPSKSKGEARKIFGLGDAAFGKAIRPFLLRLEELQKRLVYLIDPGKTVTLVDRDQGFAMTTPVPNRAATHEEAIGAVRLSVFDEEAPLLKELGYRPPEEEVLFRSYGFEPMEEGRYKVGPFVARYDGRDETIKFFRQTTPLLTLHRQGLQFVPAPGEVHGIHVEGSPLPNPLMGARLHLPLTPEMTATTGLPFEERYLLTSMGIVEQGSGARALAYRAGPFLVTHMNLKGKEGDRFLVYPVDQSTRAFAGEQVPETGFLMSANPADRGVAIMLHPHTTRPNVFVPAAGLHSPHQADLLAKMKMAIRDFGGEPMVLSNFERDMGLETEGLSLISVGEDVSGAVLVFRPTDELLWYLRVDGEVGAQSAVPVELLTLRAPPPDLGETIDHGPWTMDPENGTGGITWEVTTGKRPYPAGTRFPILLSSPPRAELGSGDPVSGEEVQRVLDPGSAGETRGRDDYQIELPVSTLADLRDGHRVKIFQGPFEQEYRLQKTKRGFDLKIGDETVGSLAVERDILDIKIGPLLHIRGPLPHREVVESLTISGSGGPRELAEFLYRLSHRLNGDLKGYDQSLRQIASVLSFYDDFSFASGVESILSIYWADVFLVVGHRSQVTSHWSLMIKRRDDTPNEVFLDFAEAVKETNALAGHPPGHGEPVESMARGALRQAQGVRESGDDLHPYGPTQGIALTLPDGSSLRGKMRSRFQDGVIDELVYSWGGHDLPLDGRRVEWGGILEEKGRSRWIEAGVVPVTFRKLVPAFSSDALKVERDLTVGISRNGIESASWGEHRTYQLEGDERLILTLRGNADKTIQIESAKLVRATGDLSLASSKRVVSWGDVIDLSLNYQTSHGLRRVHRRLVVENLPQKDDVSLELARVINLDLPYVENGKLRIVSEEAGDGSLEVHSVEFVQKDHVVPLRGRISVKEGFRTELTISSSHPLFGELQMPLSLSYSDSGFRVASPLVFGSDERGIHWVGHPTEKGFRFQKLAIARGEVYPAASFTQDVNEGDLTYVSFPGHFPVEFVLELADGRPLLTPVTIPAMPTPYVPLSDAEFSLTPTLFSDGVDLRPRSEPNQPLPFDVREIEQRYTTDVTDLLAKLSGDEVFYPTMESMNGMMRVVREGKRGEAVCLQFVSTSSNIVFEEVFVYDPEDPVKWRPAGVEGQSQMVDHTSRWNGQERQTVYYRLNSRTHQWLPIPPGSTRLHSLSLPGDLGLFCLINATGATYLQMQRRRQKAQEGFHGYLTVQAAGLVEKVTTRFALEPRWSVDEVGLAQVTLGEETFSESGPVATGRWLNFSSLINGDHTAVSFDRGRTEIVIGETQPRHGELVESMAGGPTDAVRRAHRVLFRGFFQGFRQPGSNHFVFVEISRRHGDKPRVFRMTLLPGADPLVVETPYDDLFKPLPRISWLYDSGLVGKDDVREKETEKRKGKYVSPDPVHGAVTTRPFLIKGPTRQAGRDLLPYVINEAEWESVETIQKEAIDGSHVALLEQWLNPGGSDFQLLPESVVEFRRAQGRLDRIPQAKWKEEIPKMEPVLLWLVNARGTLVQVRLLPYLPRGSKAPSWVFHPDGSRNEGLTLRFVGKNPETGQMIQIYAPVTYDRQGKQQILRVFDPKKLTGILQTLKIVTYDGDSDDEGVNANSLFALYDATERPKPESAAERTEQLWTSPKRRQRIAMRRLIRLSGLVQEAEEMFVARKVGAQLMAPLQEPELVEADGQYHFRWHLREFERRGEGGFTGKQVQISYPLKHLTEPESARWSRIPLEFADKITLRMRNDLLDAEGTWHDVTFDIYRTPDEALLLVDPTNLSRRYVLSFDTAEGREGWPILRQVRGFEAGLTDFYNPPQWNLSYQVERVISRKETHGVGRVLDVSSEYREARRLPDGHHVYRYFFEVEEIQAACEIDLLISPDGKIVRAFEDSWQIEGLKKPLNRAWISSEVVNDDEGLPEGHLRVYLKHRARGYQEAVGNTHFLRVDFSPDPETGDFLGQGVSISQLYYRQMSKDPRVLFFPSEKKQPFLYQRYEGDDNPQDGYLVSRPYRVKVPSADSPVLSSVHLTFIFYDSLARDRRELQFVLQKGVGGKLNQVGRDSVRLFNFQTGEEIDVGAEGKLERVEEVGRTKFALSWKPFKVVFFLDDEGNLPKGLEGSFFFQSVAKRQVVAMAEGLREVSPEVMARARKLFEATWGYPADHEGPAPEVNASLPGQKWRWGFLAEGDHAELLGDEAEVETRRIWFAACLVCCRTRKVFDPPTSDDARVLTDLANREPIRWEEIRARAQVRPMEGETDSEAADRLTATATQAEAEREEQLAPIREVLARLRASVDPEDREMLAIVEEVAQGTPLDEAIPDDWDDEKRERIVGRIRALFAEWGSKLGEQVGDPEELRRWFLAYIDGVGAPFIAPLQEFASSDIFKTGFGLAVIEGLKTFVTIPRPDDSVNREIVERFTSNLMNAALAVYRDKNEIVAELLAEVLVGISLATDLEDQNREDVLARSVRDEILRNSDRLEAFHAFAVVAPYIREDLCDRVLRVLRRPNIGEAEKSLLDTLMETHFTDNTRHPVKVWKQRYGIRHWLSPLDSGGGGNQSGPGGKAEGRPHSSAGRSTATLTGRADGKSFRNSASLQFRLSSSALPRWVPLRSAEGLVSGPPSASATGPVDSGYVKEGWTREKLLRLGLAVIARDPELRALVREVEARRKMSARCIALAGVLMVSCGRVTAADFRSILVKKGFLEAGIQGGWAGSAAHPFVAGSISLPSAALRPLVVH